MRVVFMGTPEFAVPCLNVLVEDHDLVAVVTQPDRPKGRGRHLAPSPVKERAQELGVAIYQPVEVGCEQFVTTLLELDPEVIIVVAFGQKIPDTILHAPPHGCINVHASLLPRYRGAAPINRAIVAGETTTGVTTMYLSSQWDAGDIILQSNEAITPKDTAGTLHDRLALKGADVLRETLRQVAKSTAIRVAQDHGMATYAPKLTKQEAEIPWSTGAAQLDCFIRGMNPWPGAYTYYQGTMIKVWGVTVLAQGQVGVEPGEVVSVDDSGLVVSTKDGLLRLDEVQRQGAQRMRGFDLANGLHLRPGDRLSSGASQHAD